MTAGSQGLGKETTLYMKICKKKKEKEKKEQVVEDKEDINSMLY